MVITRSPLRISLGGGGTDLPSYYRKFEGFLIAGAINKYIYTLINRPFGEGIRLKYSDIENVQQVHDVKHKIIREALVLQNLQTPQIEISSVADIPSGTGLGSSGSFTTSLLLALFTHRRKMIDSKDLAELACHIEIDKLGEPIGKQDQYISAFGGLTCFTFHQDDTVTVEPLNAHVDTIFDLEDNLLLFFTGMSRSASDILRDQDFKSQKDDEDMIKNLHYIKELGYRSRDALRSGDTVSFGELMNEHWQFKRRRSRGMTNSKIDEYYDAALRSGATGGKLVGAGGGGFLLFHAKDRSKLRRTMTSMGLQEVRFGFDFEGSKVVIG